MTTNSGREAEKAELVGSAAEAGETARAMEKLMKGPVEVSVNERQHELDLLELDELTIKTNLGNLDQTTEEGKRITQQAQDALKAIDLKKAELEKYSVRAYIMPLKYRDTRKVQTAIAEAILSVEGMGFDNDTKLVMMMAERKYMTVYLSLRKFANYNELYYPNLDAIAKVSENSVDRVYEAYVREFELTQDERKNS